MTEVVLDNIDTINDLALFADAYKKGHIKVNISKLSKELNKDRKTVKKYLNGNIPKTNRNRSKYLDDYRDVIINLLSDRYRSFDYIDHLYYYLVREHGIECSRSTLNRYIREDEILDGLFRRKRVQKFFERFETGPGVQAQFDLKEKIKIILETGEVQRVNVATLTLGFSRYNIREIVLDTKYETIISFLAGAFEKLGGAPKELVIDNIKCLVDKPRTIDNDAVLNVKFEEFLKNTILNVNPVCLIVPKQRVRQKHKIKNHHN